MNQGQKLLVNFKNKEGRAKTNTVRMIIAASEFYGRLYGRNKEHEEEGIRDGGRKWGEEEVPKILEREK